MDINVFRGLMTLTFLIAFLGIVVYAWSSRNRARFDEAARLPLDLPADTPASDSSSSQSGVARRG